MKTLRLLVLLFFGCFANVEAGTLFRLPLNSHPGRYTGWFDHNTSAGATRRYDCVTGTPYDGHKGTDFPVGMGTAVVAGASGNMYKWVNNCPDGSNPSCGDGFGNHIRIRHPMDGKVTIHAHLKYFRVNTPLTNPPCGQTIGYSGNSGKSDGPHLHYELRTSNTGTRLDFFGGSCNSPSYWVNQNGGFPTTQCQ